MSLRISGLLVCYLLLTAVPAAAQAAGLELKAADQIPPTEFAESIRNALSTQSIQLIGPEPVLEFWFRKDIPLKTKPDSSEAAIKAIEEGTLLGVARFNEDRRDFRDDKIKAGLYTMRFALQPQDGDHMGTAPVPYFVLLTPADADTDLEAAKGHDAVIKLAQGAQKHPRSLNLRPAENVEGEFPRTEDGFDETKIVWVKLPAKTESGEEVPLIFGLVYEGHGEV